MMKDRHARYAALASAKENDAMGMELEERGVGATLRLWNDHDLKLLSDVGAQDAVRTAIAMEFANKSTGDDVTLSNMRPDDRDDNGILFDVRVKLMSYAKVRPVTRLISRAFNNPSSFEARVRSELQSAGRPHKARARIVREHGELLTPRAEQTAPQITKLFPSAADDVGRVRERLDGMERRAAEREAARLAKLHAGKVRVQGDRFWRCFNCQQRNRVGTQVCATCKRDSSFTPKSSILLGKPIALPLHATGPENMSVEQVFQLAKEGVDFNERDHYGLSALHAAAKAGKASIVDALLRSRPIRVDLEARTKDDWRALHYAANAGSSEVIERLVQEGCELDTLTRAAGHAPLHLCAIANTHRAAIKLIEAGVDVDVRSRVTAQTPLHLACWHGNIEMTELLLKAGADPEARDREGWVPLQLAEFRGHDQVEYVLLDNGADKGDWQSALWDAVKEASASATEGAGGRRSY